jgi:Polymer-forming cytoskeletal
MFALKRRGTVIAEGLKIVGGVTAEGLVEVNGQVDGELHCSSLILSRKAHVTGSITAERVVVDGSVEVLYKPQTWFSSRTRMLLAIFVTDLSPSRGVPTLKAAPCRPMDQMGTAR